MWLAVRKVEATNDYKLILTFENSEIRCLDMNPYFNFGRFAELKNIDEFKKVRVCFDTIEWENGLDLDPEFLYKKSVEISN
ncbi:DUF2442 domain-containing protein [candidate division KSB1 bacterium]|nr:DUF2442 domain-containing protein [candidate division KSB1 bacterium]MBL7094680.1 DUF2442 domain-containing protein [candidate division KSB1 bacterium]